jgi:hypothetical protein
VSQAGIKKTFDPNRARHRSVAGTWRLDGEELACARHPRRRPRNNRLSGKARGTKLLDLAVLQNPDPLYRQMRHEAPVYRDRRFMGWILTRRDDVLALLRDPGCPRSAR